MLHLVVKRVKRMREGNRNLGHYVNTFKPGRLISWLQSGIKQSIWSACMCLCNVLNFGFLTSFAWLHVFWHCNLQLHSFSGKLDTIRLIAWLRFKFGLESSNQSNECWLFWNYERFYKHVTKPCIHLSEESHDERMLRQNHRTEVRLG